MDKKHIVYPFINIIDSDTEYESDKIIICDNKDNKILINVLYEYKIIGIKEFCIMTDFIKLKFINHFITGPKFNIRFIIDISDNILLKNLFQDINNKIKNTYGYDIAIGMKHNNNLISMNIIKSTNILFHNTKTKEITLLNDRLDTVEPITTYQNIKSNLSLFKPTPIKKINECSYGSLKYRTNNDLYYQVKLILSFSCVKLGGIYKPIFKITAKDIEIKYNKSFIISQLNNETKNITNKNIIETLEV